MDKVTVPIFFDYASTLCYVAWRIVSELERELDFAPLWKGVPIGMRDGRCRPGIPLGTIERMKVQTVIAETGIQVAPPACWVDSENALIGSEIARESGAFRAYHDGIFRAIFEDEREVSDLSVLCDIAAAAKIDGEMFRERVLNRASLAKIDANRAEADAFSALGYPTFILGDFPLIGIQPLETMRMILRRFIEQRRNEPGM